MCALIGKGLAVAGATAVQLVPIDAPDTALLHHAHEVNFAINGLTVCVGFGIGGGGMYLLRRLVKHRDLYDAPRWLAVGAAAATIAIAVVPELFELWKRTVYTRLDNYGSVGYFSVGVLFAICVFSEWVAAASKELSSTAVGRLQSDLQKAKHGFDVFASLEALVSEVMHAKLERLSQRRATGNGELIDALAPAEQILVLIRVLHGHFAKSVNPGKRLRIGVYMPAEDGKALEPAYSWDGKKTGCFSGKHQEFMRIGNPGGARSEVVKCWESEEPFRFVADGLNSKTFRYFSSGQEKSLRSMVAYRHNLTGLSPDDAFVITLDSDIPDFFSGDRQTECEVLLPAFSRRIELELLACPTPPE